MAQWVKHFTHKHEVLSFNPQGPECICDSRPPAVSSQQAQGTLAARGPAKPVISCERPLSQKIKSLKGGDQRLTPKTAPAHVRHL